MHLAMVVDPFFLATVVFCFLLHLVVRRLTKRWNTALPLPPGPGGLPFLGSLPFIGSAPHSGLARLAKRYGPIMYLKMGTRNAVVVSSPSAARAFLTTLDKQFANRPDSISARELTYNRGTLVFSDYNPRWKYERKLLSVHMLGARAMADWAPLRRAEAGNLVKSMAAVSKEGKPVVVPEMVVCALANIIGQLLLSKRVFESQGKESKEFKDMIVELLTGGGLFNIGDFIPAIAFLDLQGIQAKMKRIHLKFDALVSKMLEEHAATSEQRKAKPDFVDVVMQNRVGDDGVTITDENIKGLIFDLFTAGTDTASIILEWALAEMIKNPAIMRRAQHELDSVVGRDRRLEESDIPRLPYLQAIVKEAMRKHPSTPLSIPHYSFEPCDVDGYHIPGNTRLLINIWAIGRDSEVWVEPLRFNPDRFLTGQTAKIEFNGNDFELIPFGAGRRICAGKQAGIVFVQYFLGTLVHAFDWFVPDAENMNMDETPGLVLPKTVPITATVTPRLAPGCYT